MRPGALEPGGLPPLMWLPFFVLGALVAYGNVLTTFFSSDDFGLVWLVSDRGFAAVATPFVGLFFRPLVWLTLAFDQKLWGLNPTGFHLTNIALHGASAWLVFLLARHLFAGTRGRTVASALTGAAFLVLPSHTEAVSWISGRCDVLAAVCCLGSLVLFLSFRQTGRRASLGGSLTLFFLGLLAKESALALPGIVIALVVLEPGHDGGLRQRLAKGWRPTALYVACLVPYLLVRVVAIGGLVAGYGSSVHLRLAPTVLGRNVLFYAGRTAFPATQWAFDWLILLPKLAWAGIGALVLLAWLAALAVEHRRGHQSFLPWLFSAFFLSLLPVINLGVSPADTQGERFLYMASAFFCLGVGVVLVKVLRRWVGTVALLFVLFVGWGVSLWRANEQWREAGALARTILGEIDALGTGRRLFVLVLPGDLRGAYVFRNGIREGVMLFCRNIRFDGRVLIATSAQRAPTDEVAVAAKDNAITVRQVTVNGGFTRAEQTSFGYPSGTYRIDRFSPNQFEVTFGDLEPADRIVYFSGGRLRAR